MIVFSRSAGVPRCRAKPPVHQRGAALLLFFVLVGFGLLALFVSRMSVNDSKLERDKVTDRALAKAKEALLAFAATHPTRGHLPCPEDSSLVGLPNEGKALTSCATDAKRIGRLPWKTLGLGSDLRDGFGERLWYAASSSTTIDAPVINSDTVVPTLSVNGITQHVAVIFSPGSPLGGQSRNSAVVTCPGFGSIRADYCPGNYLDADLPPPDGTGISNQDPDTTFVQPNICFFNATGDKVCKQFNDRLITVGPDEFLRTVENRVLNQVKACLQSYAIEPGNINNLYPWADQVDPASPAAGDYSDDLGIRIGRLPNILKPTSDPTSSAFKTNVTSWKGNSCPLYSASPKGWFNDWKELVFYAVSERFSPNGGGASATSGAWLTVGGNSNIRAAVILAGKVLTTTFPPQQRILPADKLTRSKYLEDENANGDNITGDDVYSALPSTSTYNDKTISITN